uniref:EGF-like domain-containing protein n=1 Tax=Heliothis virescens TaxID=7102 RepID=A0A2A4JCP2_HELVI
MYRCPSGFTGVTCEYPCPLGTYGVDCKEKCTCKNGADCHHVTGECQCLPGWRGARCETACSAGWWGAACSQPCRCAPHAACRPNDGYCRCPPGYTGHYCTQFCPEGYFGDHCMQACNCSSEGNWVCDPVAGCICHRGFVGEHCDTHATDAIVTGIDPRNTSNSGLTVVILILAFICAATAILVLLYYRKRVRNLKREIAHVHYTADPNSQPEQQHFDNPVYSYQGSARSDDSTTLLNNTILNNLGPGSKLNNATMEKLRMKASGSSDSYDPLSSMKNKDADANNPNLFQYEEDDNKLDHVYDEIKHKEGYEMEYDRLNYTPPANKWKPHYQRMTNGFSVANTTPSVASRDTPTPPIPPLPKLNIVPLPPARDADTLDIPAPPAREDPPLTPSDENSEPTQP